MPHVQGQAAGASDQLGSGTPSPPPMPAPLPAVDSPPLFERSDFDDFLNPVAPPQPIEAAQQQGAARRQPHRRGRSPRSSKERLRLPSSYDMDIDPMPGAVSTGERRRARHSAVAGAGHAADGGDHSGAGARLQRSACSSDAPSNDVRRTGAVPNCCLLRLLVLTLVFGGLNAVKPLHIDDAAYFYDARQIAAHPLDPYGTWIIWWQNPQPANEILAPPVVPYTWALGLRLFGDRPAACKLLLLPWAFLLIYACFSLARRFASGMEWPLTILTIFSPALWPAFNFMLDLPALGLALLGIELFLRACDGTSFFKAACAGLIVGIGFETKYTACVAVAAILLASRSVATKAWGAGAWSPCCS